MNMEILTETILPNSIEREPIHLYNRIQPHGILFVLEEPDLRVLQTSSNTRSILGIAGEEIIDRTLEEIFDPVQIDPLRTAIYENDFDALNPSKIWARLGGDDFVVFDAIFHRNADNLLILELEPAVSYENIPFLRFYHLAKTSIDKLEETPSLKDFCNTIVREVRKMTGFDRVMLYKFDEEDHGDVIAEDKIDELEPYLGLRYPASDIPLPARRLLSSNWIRQIPDATEEAVDMIPRLNPLNDQPLNLTLSSLRAASPCHLEYLHNMGVGASLTISLIENKRLWGIIACHHRTPKFVPYELRKACEFLGRVVFSEISAREETEDYDYRVSLSRIQSQLVDFMTREENFIEGLVARQPNLLDLTGAAGAAIALGGHYTLIGQTPDEEELNYLINWLEKNVHEEVFYTNSLPRLYSDAGKYKDIASGLLAIPIAKRNYLLWFRPEVIQTVNWGGDPGKAIEAVRVDGEIRLSPRKSFELWKETVRLKSLPWKAVEINAALELRKAIVNIILKQADELARLARDLELSNAELKKFAYVASHDLQEPLNQVANYVQLLELRYHSELDEDAQEFITFAVEGVSLMQTLIDDVLAYSKVDVQGVEFATIDGNEAIEKALANLRGRIHENHARITVDPLPIVMADKTQLMQLFQNLIGNAIKFRGPDTPTVHISARREEEEWLFSVSDNGIGIDSRFFDRIFVIFQRLHTRDEYPGTGMGLAICKKIIECHRGRIWVESEVGKGSTFYFTIPLGGGDRERRRGRSAQNYLVGGRQ
jgi:two-component system, chemotaxis family, sensor kinase Cph1